MGRERRLLKGCFSGAAGRQVLGLRTAMSAKVRLRAAQRDSRDRAPGALAGQEGSHIFYSRR